MFGRIWGFVWQRKKYWLVPLVLVTLIFTALIFMARRDAVGPFQYNLF